MYQFFVFDVGAANRYPAVLNPSPWLKSFGSGYVLKNFITTGLGPTGPV
jgi:hypothetical protein